MSQNLPLYEPRFYERMAQQHVTRLFPGPTFVNVRWGLIGSLATRHELDALVFQTRHAVPVEIKAHPLSDGDTDEIVAKYGLMGFPRIILIAPSVSAKASRRLADSKASVRRVHRFSSRSRHYSRLVLYYLTSEGARVDSCRLEKRPPSCAVRA